VSLPLSACAGALSGGLEGDLDLLGLSAFDVSCCSPFDDSTPPAPLLQLALDRKKVAAFSALGGGFLLFPLCGRRCNRTRASVGNAGGNARPSLTNARQL